MLTVEIELLGLDLYVQKHIFNSARQLYCLSTLILVWRFEARSLERFRKSSNKYRVFYWYILLFSVS